jgi:hypothetical protein
MSQRIKSDDVWKFSEKTAVTLTESLESENPLEVWVSWHHQKINRIKSLPLLKSFHTGNQYNLGKKNFLPTLPCNFCPFVVSEFLSGPTCFVLSKHMCLFAINLKSTESIICRAMVTKWCGLVCTSVLLIFYLPEESHPVTRTLVWKLQREAGHSIPQTHLHMGELQTKIILQLDTYPVWYVMWYISKHIFMCFCSFQNFIFC